MASRKTVYVDSDVLVIGGGFGGCGAAYESRYWGRDKKIVVVEKANIERSGAVAQGLYAINCYMGMHWNENQPEDHVRYARNDLMGLNLIRLRRSKISNENIKKIQSAYDIIFKSIKFRENIENLSDELKKNEFVKKILNFLNTDKKRPISLPPDIK